MGNELKPIGIVERASKFLDIQSYGSLLPETRKLWIAWLIGFHESEVNRPKATESADTTRDGLVKARDVLREYADRCDCGHGKGGHGNEKVTYCMAGDCMCNEFHSAAADVLEAIEAAIAEEGKDAG